MLINVLKYLFLLAVTSILLIIFYVLVSQKMFDPDIVPEHYGKVHAELFTEKGKKQPLLVYFGGSEGGNSMTKEHNIAEREQYINSGYAMLAIGYFGMKGIPKDLDRISLNAIHDEIKRAQNDDSIDASCVAVIGGSKGAELALVLASKYSDINAVVSLAGSHVSFNAISIASDGRTASFQYNDSPIPFITIPYKALPHFFTGNFRKGFEIAMEDKKALKAAEIAVENINGPILLISGEKDHVWPSAEMSNEVTRRLKNKEFQHPYQHIIVPNGNHFQPQSDYHAQVIEFLDKNFKPTCENVPSTFI
ncbi:acyl-CoA thioester hydrolase/BAAT C-terminal domain-containing protein [Flocculibacter collagenilyticus]|uniref:acyl-CoA thioester hydrolase/BAAT C-terminal domain-containing protein n=1 Tax=Flocculibacter collagenilyticus TaxID=2744479 RepID=UPI0018F52FDC|nr:acyl-CoA thioester hydrolase/BAAT C-terminal domain-containing protein [Flocculibacter collagenilyticus]